MTRVYYVFLKLAVCFILGVVLSKTRVIDTRAEKGLSDLLIKAFLPFMIISSSQYRYKDVVFLGMFAVIIFAVLYYAAATVIAYLVAKKSKIAENDKRIMAATLIFANTSFVGIPLMEEIYGEEGALLAAVFNLVFNMFFYTVGTTILSGRKFKAIYLIKDNVSVASIAAVILFLLPWRFPGLVTESIEFIGDMTFPLAMIIMGAAIAKINFKKIFSDARTYVIVALRIIVIPAAAFAIIYSISCFVPMQKVTAAAIIIMSALPSSTLNIVFADKYNTSPGLGARIVMFSTLLMVGTLFFWLWAVDKCF